MINVNFVFLGTILVLYGGISYLIDTLRGKIKPNRVTWSLWTLVPMIAFFAEIKEGAGLVSLTTFIVGFVPLLIFLASFVNKKSYWKISRFDVVCAVFSLLALLLWYITKNGNIAIFFSIIADFSAGLPTMIKSFTNPETENSLLFFFGILNAGITLLAIKTWNWANYGFPLYLLASDMIIFYLIQFKPGKWLKDFF